MHNLFTSADSTVDFTDTLNYFYSLRNYQPLFIKSFEEKSFLDSLLAIIGKADEHGLNPELYNFTQIKEEYSSSIRNTTQKPERYRHLANTEQLVCNAVLKYAYHMRYGVLDPKVIFLDSYYMPIPDSSKRDLFHPLRQNNVIQYLTDIQPKSIKYKKLQSALQYYETIRNQEWHKISVPSKKLKFGDIDSSLIKIAERLQTLGFIDRSEVNITNSISYDSLFAEQIKRYQWANGLTTDGEINKSTIAKINREPQEYINKIKVSLERIRWFDYSDTARYVIVNIPEYRLYVIENSKDVFDITVCTGRKRYASFAKQYLFYKENKHWQNKPQDWETPVLYSRLSHLVLNPTWTVPFSIMREEIVSKIKRDSTYLEKANFRVYKNGSRIDPDEVQLSDFAQGDIPYTIIQDPGAGNALGKIKFMFDNPFGVYLHDTPTRAPFKYENRAVSHGCVRVEKPLQLAEYLLDNNSKWNIDYLKIEIGTRVNDKSIVEEFRQKRSELRKNASYGSTTEVKLDKAIPLFIDYYTAWVDETGIVNLREDIYNQDKIVLEHLNSKTLSR